MPVLDAALQIEAVDPLLKSTRNLLVPLLLSLRFCLLLLVPAVLTDGCCAAAHGTDVFCSSSSVSMLRMLFAVPAREF